MRETKTKHRAAIDKLCAEHGLSDRGFYKAVWKLIPPDDLEEAKEIIRGALPDAWKISDGVIEIYEVSDTHHLSTDKMCIYADWLTYLEDFDLTVRVFEYSIAFDSMRERFAVDEWLVDLQGKILGVSDA